MPDGKSVLPTCPELNFTPIDGGTMCLNRSETPSCVGYDAFSPYSFLTTDGGLTLPAARKVELTIHGIIAAGAALSDATIVAVNAAGMKTPPGWHRFIAYETVVHVGGALAWRANNPGNLRSAPTEIAKVPGQKGEFSVFASLEAGRAAQRSLYLNRYGDRTVRDAITALTPPTDKDGNFENDTDDYLDKLEKAGIDLDKDVRSQIDALMPAVFVNEGLSAGIVVPRVP